MMRNVIDDHGGLHDRVTHEMALHPFTLAECEEYFKANDFLWERLSILQTYMALGGIPYYLSLISRDESPAMAIDRLFFSENGELQREYRRFFASLFRNPSPYTDIISLLAKHPKGLRRDEIAKALNMESNGRLSNMLLDLVYCDFIRKYNIRDRMVKENNGLYQLIDFYTFFYNTFVSKATMEEHYWTRHLGTSEVNTWNGLAYERVCKAHIPQIKRALGFESVATEFYSWRSKTLADGAQVDIIIDRADNMINLCEVKYSEHEYMLDKDEFLKIQNRVEAFRRETGTHSTILPTLITTFGLRKGMYEHQIAAKVTMDDLFIN